MTFCSRTEADHFRAAVELAGHRWPHGWTPGLGFGHESAPVAVEVPPPCQQSLLEVGGLLFAVYATAVRHGLRPENPARTSRQVLAAGAVGVRAAALRVAMRRASRRRPAALLRVLDRSVGGSRVESKNPVLNLTEKRTSHRSSPTKSSSISHRTRPITRSVEASGRRPAGPLRPAGCPVASPDHDRAAGLKIDSKRDNNIVVVCLGGPGISSSTLLPGMDRHA